MAGWIEVLTTAFLLQLLALPGEKGQFVIAGLSTRYNPYWVVAGAATAFGGWTALEILLGEALKNALPEMYLDAITAGLFVVFAGLILYSLHRDGDSGDPVARTDGGPPGDGPGLDDEGVVEQAGGYLTALSVMGVAEFGDKTQLVTISLAVQYGIHPGIWVGEMLAIVPVSLLTALVFHRGSQRFDSGWFHYAAVVVFLLFAADIVSGYVFGFSVLPI
ncbi:TMEM165/GDT1 family protein [Natronomonas gomsonensis]|uniref:TMEM165/GDT1 family protein n=1 Tax=Natronomonas gomsonensis TaxID=1046043 RepID=UPI0020CA49EC|nr:TMEM165/GDT1 family protein [Natronomonas gomsonensis]MCY4730278.1 TMEM165/GDT1 family protein [Natronomonas gomsonensis]